jgi:hypothetical protein
VARTLNNYLRVEFKDVRPFSMVGETSDHGVEAAPQVITVAVDCGAESKGLASRRYRWGRRCWERPAKRKGGRLVLISVCAELRKRR